MQMGAIISKFRKEKGLTQEGLAKLLNVTNQSVSKWESDQCCPDIGLLPQLADVFGISLDVLFGREVPKPGPVLPWEDDGTLRAVLFAGHTLVDGQEAAERIEFCYEGPALNISSTFSVICDSVGGNVTAGDNVTCDGVGGNVQAGADVTCDNVYGSVTAGRDVTCDSIDGSVIAGRDVRCDEICGSCISAGGSVYCDHMEE